MTKYGILKRDRTKEIHANKYKSVYFFLKEKNIRQEVLPETPQETSAKTFKDFLRNSCKSFFRLFLALGIFYGGILRSINLEGG